MNELKLCPFCGGKPRIKSHKYNDLGAYGDSSTEHQYYAIYCTKCGISQKNRKYFSKEEAVEVWNRRKNNE